MIGFGFGFGFNTLGTLLNQTTAPAISGIVTSLVADTGFTIGATVNPNGAETTVTIEYGLTAAYGSTQATVTGSPLTETGAISAELTGLAQNTLYHYRIKAVNSEGTTYSSDATQTTTNVRWILPITGRASGTATAGTLVFTCSEDVTPTVTGDVTISIARANDPSASLRKHTLTVNCPNNGSGTIIVPDRSKVLSCGGHNGTGDPSTAFYAGTNATAPILTWNLNDLPSTIIKINQSTEYANILPTTGTTALPSGLTFLSLFGVNIAWTYTGALPTGLKSLSLLGANIRWTYAGALPTGLTALYLNGQNISWTYTGALPTGLTYIAISWNGAIWTYNGALPSGLNSISLNGGGLDWTYNQISGSSNFNTFTLSNYRQTKISSADMITLLDSMRTKTGTFPATVTINDYADYASPPAGVVTAVNALKAAKSITTVNLGA